MRKNFPRLFLGVLFLLLIAGFLGKRVFRLEHSGKSSFPDKAVVTTVYDGDTIKVKFDTGLEKRVRLIGIDAPEMESPDPEKKFLAYMAKRFTFFHLYNKKVTLTYDWELHDDYGRLLAYVWSGKEELFNKFMLREGFASAFLRFPFRKDYRKEFIQAEREAHQNNRGIWRGEPYPSLSVREVKDHLGEIVSVVFLCSEMDKERRFLFLRPARSDFCALIHEENVSLFPDVQFYQGKTLSVTGFLEKYRGQPQIMVYFPQQIVEMNS
ncbi:MAG: thermonuclease family protein [Candidatus Aminicenantes bacterium]